jgi:peptidase
MQGKFAYFAVQFEFLNQLFNHIMKTISKLICVMLCVFATTPAFAQFNLKKAVGGAAKAVQAATLTDEQMTAYVKEYIDWMDTHNKVCEPDHPYTQRLNRLTEGLTDVEGIPLNFKVYWVVDVNAFACADGSVRVFAALMDIMSDEELLGVIGHEIGHVAHKDSKKAFRTALLTSALKDGISANGGTIAALTDSQIGDLGEALANAKYSQKQENQADDYGYEFLKKSGKNPWAMALSFKRLKEIQGEGKQSKINQLFSSHPDLDKRIQRMEKRATDEGITPPEVKAEEKK